MASGVNGLASAGAWSLAGAALGFALLFPFYVLRFAGLGYAVGAGDVKLLAALGAILGPAGLASVAVYGAIVGGAQAVIVLTRKKRLGLFLHQTLVMRVAPSLSGAKAPYAVPIAAGVLLATALPPVFSV
jgi:prepilin peptidase CpaA